MRFHDRLFTDGIDRDSTCCIHMFDRRLLLGQKKNAPRDSTGGGKISSHDQGPSFRTNRAVSAGLSQRFEGI